MEKTEVFGLEITLRAERRRDVNTSGLEITLRAERRRDANTHPSIGKAKGEERSCRALRKRGELPKEGSNLEKPKKEGSNRPSERRQRRASEEISGSEARNATEQRPKGPPKRIQGDHKRRSGKRKDQEIERGQASKVNQIGERTKTGGC